MIDHCEIHEDHTTKKNRTIVVEGEVLMHPPSNMFGLLDQVRGTRLADSQTYTGCQVYQSLGFSRPQDAPKEPGAKTWENLGRYRSLCLCSVEYVQEIRGYWRRALNFPLETEVVPGIFQVD